MTATTMTRAELLADKHLIDVTGMASLAEYTLPVHITRAAWNRHMAWPERDDPRRARHEMNRLWDAICRAPHKDIKPDRPQTFPFVPFSRTQEEKRSRQPVILGIRMDSDDDGKKVLTLCLPSEL